MAPEDFDNIKQFFSEILHSYDERLEEKLNKLVQTHLHASSPVYKNNATPPEISQRILQANWLQLIRNGHVFSDLSETGFRVFSQNNEDGILLYLFTLLGTHNKLAVEIGANCEDSDIGFPQCNSANLVLNHGWNSLIIDGSATNVGQLRHFFASAMNSKHFHWFGRESLQEGESYYYTPMLQDAFINKKNINEIIASWGIKGEIDLLSIDLDGMDYWIWKAISVVNPRVVVVEFNNRISPDVAVTVEYSDDYVVDTSKREVWAAGGVSLLALVKLAAELGYTLVAVNNSRINAFFIRNDVLPKSLSPLSISDVFQNQHTVGIKKQDYYLGQGGVFV